MHLWLSSEAAHHQLSGRIKVAAVAGCALRCGSGGGSWRGCSCFIDSITEANLCLAGLFPHQKGFAKEGAKVY